MVAGASADFSAFTRNFRRCPMNRVALCHDALPRTLARDINPAESRRGNRTPRRSQNRLCGSST